MTERKSKAPVLRDDCEAASLEASACEELLLDDLPIEDLPIEEMPPEVSFDALLGASAAHETIAPPEYFRELMDGAWEGLTDEELAGSDGEVDDIDLTGAYAAGADPEPAADAPARPADDVFNVESAPLLGTTLLEASAGTGKTFSIKHLVLRLVAELDFSIEKLLVVSFTRAATAELSARIQHHLAQASAYLSGEKTEEETDDLIVRQVRAWEAAGLDRETACARVRASLTGFDNASILTIHAFCQKMLKNHAFTASGNLSEELSDDDGDVFSDAVEDFLRRELDRLPDEGDRRALLRTESWERILRALDGQPADLVRHRAAPADDGTSPAVNAAFERFVTEMPGRVAEEKARRGIQTFDDMLTGMWRTIAADTDGHFTAGIRRAYRGVLIDEFQDTDPIQFAIFDKLFLSGLSVEERLRRSLFFVGDPKQAIYRFRSADLNTYLRARAIVSGAPDGRLPRLSTNFRSSKPLVEALNAFYSRPGAGTPFMRPGLEYRSVDASGRRAGLWVKENGDLYPALPFEIWGRTEPLGSADENDGELDRAVAFDIKLWVERGRAGEALLPWEDEKDDASLVCETLEVDGKSRPMRALEARDVAVLVRSRDEARGIIAELQKLGIRVRISSQESVFATDEAMELLLLLRAVSAPADERLMKAVRTTRLFGETLADVRADDEARRIAVRERLEAARELWMQRGVAAAVESVTTGEHLAERLLPVRLGERRLANYAHLVELLHEAGRRYQTPAGLISWFERKMTDTKDDEAAKMRLESDANLVTVETIHSSKGLEYPIVYWPYAHKGYSKQKSATFRRVNPKTGEAVLEVSPVPVTEADDLAEEGMEELTRLGYVALTRASARLVVGATMIRKSERSAEWRANRLKNPFFWSLTRSWDPTQAGVVEALRELQAIEGLAGAEGIRWRETDDVLAKAQGEVERYDAARPMPDEDDFGVSPAHDVRAAWRTASFTGLTRTLGDDEPAAAHFAPRKRLELSDRILTFPRGPRAGDALHRVLETADFQAMAPETEAVRAMRTAHAERVIGETLEFSEAEKPLAAAAVARMIGDVLNSELLPGVRLRDVPPEARTAEMEFLLSMPSNLTAARLGEALARLDPRYAVPGLTEASLTGYLTGFIDLAFGAGGRFWILDWKSNAIADEREGFTEEAMAAEMTRHHYRLQYLLYGVALRRCLRARLGDEFRESMIGGAIYVFLRGLSAEDELDANGRRPGVVVDEVHPAVLRCLDELFANGWSEETVRKAEAEIGRAGARH